MNKKVAKKSSIQFLKKIIMIALIFSSAITIITFGIYFWIEELTEYGEKRNNRSLVVGIFFYKSFSGYSNS